MEEGAAIYELHGLTQGERFELANLASGGSVSFVDESVPEESAGEIALATAIVIGSVVGLKALAQFLLWRHHGESFEETIEVTRSDGSKIKRRVAWRKGKADDPEDGLVKQLTSLPASDIGAG